VRYLPEATPTPALDKNDQKICLPIDATSWHTFNGPGNNGCHHRPMPFVMSASNLPSKGHAVEPAESSAVASGLIDPVNSDRLLQDLVSSLAKAKF
jgi:hypothetical protein